MNDPLISVIIPVYNCEKTIATAIHSILNQTYKNTEVIVIDDASTDNTREIIKDLEKQDNRVRHYDGKPDPFRFDPRLNRNINAGYSARNLGFKKAQGALITFQDADDASLLNRLEIQYNLLKKYNSTHLTIDWIQYDEKLLNKKLDMSNFANTAPSFGPNELYAMSQRSKGFLAKFSRPLNTAIPFYWKRKKIINKLFFGSLENYPGASNSPLFKKEVIEKIQFRKLKDRVWPSFMGRGADKDFNFAVAETFRNSHVFRIPLYMWRVRNKNQDISSLSLGFLD